MEGYSQFHKSTQVLSDKCHCCSNFTSSIIIDDDHDHDDDNDDHDHDHDDNDDDDDE